MGTEIVPTGENDGLPDLGKRLTPDQVVNHVRSIEEIKKRVMVEGQHFGTIPGCGDKPALLKPGAEKLLLLFGLASSMSVQQRDFPNGHREYTVTIEVLSNGRKIAEGIGSCSTLEKKYRWRDGERKCPDCGKPGTIIKGKAEFGGGWLCWHKKGGCGAKFPDGSQAIESQSVERVENPDVADVYNTVLKMAKKRAMVDAALTATASSDFFAQDIDELDIRDAVFTEKEEIKGRRPPPAPAAPREAAEKLAPKPAVKPAARPKPSSAPQEDPTAVEVLVGGGEQQAPSELGDPPESGPDDDFMSGPPVEDPQAAPEVVPDQPPEGKNPENGVILKSQGGLFFTEWSGLADEERAVNGHCTKKQLNYLSALVKKTGTDPAKLRAEIQRRWPEVVRSWQLSKQNIGIVIDRLQVKAQ